MAENPLVLCIIDGFGYSIDDEYNAIKKARIPVIDSLCANYPSTLLHCSGLHVGLPDGQMGNSEVGHTAIGLGRVMFQDLPKISLSVKNDALKDNEELCELISTLKHADGTCHLWGLLSDGGIHSHCEHIYAIVDILLKNNIKVVFHACLDGRDTFPQSALKYIADFEHKFGAKAPIVTLSGRYYSMDRDKRWERTEEAYDMMLNPSKFCKSALEYVQQSYDAQVMDEFVKPVAINGYCGIKPNDALIVCNFRADRVRQLLSALMFEDFIAFERKYTKPNFSKVIGLTSYSKELDSCVGVMFKKDAVKNSMGEVLSVHGMSQLRAAETEKYPHITFFFNGGKEEPFHGEERLLVPSPSVATYDLSPKMSAEKLTEMVVADLEAGQHNVYVINYANPDMVGHTGVFNAVVEAVEYVDKCIGNLSEVVARKKGHLLLTADHGNAERMFDAEQNQPNTAHTTNDVIFILVSEMYKAQKLKHGGGLQDIAPTMLKILGIDKPCEMTGTDLFL